MKKDEKTELHPAVLRLLLSCALQQTVEEMLEKGTKVRSAGVLVSNPVPKLYSVEIRIIKAIGREVHVEVDKPLDPIDALDALKGSPAYDLLKGMAEEAMCKAELSGVCRYMKQVGELTREFEIELDLPDYEVEPWRVRVEMVRAEKAQSD